MSYRSKQALPCLQNYFYKFCHGSVSFQTLMAWSSYEIITHAICSRIASINQKIDNARYHVVTFKKSSNLLVEHFNSVLHLFFCHTKDLKYHQESSEVKSHLPIPKLNKISQSTENLFSFSNQNRPIRTKQKPPKALRRHMSSYTKICIDVKRL